MEFNILELFDWLASEQGFKAFLEYNWFQGLLLIAFVIYLETFVIFLSFLPSDSLLITVGVFVGSLGVNKLMAISIISTGAVLADLSCYLLGRSHFGRVVVKEKWLKKEHVKKTEDFYAKYGGFSIMIGRFFPILRTLTPFLAGVIDMPFHKYIMYSITGAIMWVGGLVGLGILVSSVPFIKENIVYAPMFFLSFGICAITVVAFKRFVLGHK